MKSYALTLGARNTPAAGRHFSAADEKGIRDITRRYFPEGFTILNAKGGWWDASRRRFTQEDSRQIFIRSASRARLLRWCRALGKFLRQKELLVTALGPSIIVQTTSRS